MTAASRDISDHKRQAGNIYARIPETLPAELLETLFQNRALRIEKIVSKGHITPEGSWYDQDCGEWVLLLQGRATLLFEDEAKTIDLGAGDYVFIAPHRKHRVTWTDPQQKSIWLAIHLAPDKDAEKG